MKVFEEYIIPINETAKDYDEIFIGIIRKQPELIRCKDCKWCVVICEVDDDSYVQFFKCTNWNGTTDADGYCCAAVRKEE